MNNVFTRNDSQSSLNEFLGKTYGFMGLAVFISALSAYATLKFYPALAVNVRFAWLSFAISLIIAFTFNKATVRNASTGMLMMVIFSAIEGISLSSLAFAYTGSTITGAFISASAIFIGMAFLGATTKMDLTKLSTYLFVGLIGIIIVSLVNILLLKSSGVSFILSIVSVIIFTGYTAYDAQNASRSYYQLNSLGISENSMAIINAFNLYLDFDNLFIDLVQIFGAFSDNN